MSVLLEFHSLVIRRDRIAAVFPGGWEQYVAEYGLPEEGWWDEDLLRYGAMDGFSMELLVQDARALGLRLTSKRDGREVFQDMCILSSPDFRPALPCDWLEVRSEGTAVFVGRNRKPRRPRMRMADRKREAERTRDAILSLLAVPPADREPMPLHRADGVTGTLRTEPGTRRSLVVESRVGREAYRWVEDVVNAGWEV